MKAGRFLVPPSMRTSFNHPVARPSMSEIGEKLGQDMNKVGDHFKENYNPKDSFFKKDEKQGRSVNNLWTGYKLGGPANLMVAGSMLGGGAIVASNPKGTIQNGYNRTNIVEAESEAQDIESLQSTRADGQGYKAALGAAAMQQLNASGDLVFAMHKTRHSGQL